LRRSRTVAADTLFVLTCLRGGVYGPSKHVLGRTKLKILLGLLVVVALLVAGLRIAPVYVSAYQFEDAMRSEARMFPTAWPAKTTEQVQEELYEKARDLNLPIRQDQIAVSSVPGGIGITCRFNVRVDLFVLERNFVFNFSTTSQGAQ
jgi:hypothetical protein